MRVIRGAAFHRSVVVKPLFRFFGDITVFADSVVVPRALVAPSPTALWADVWPIRRGPIGQNGWAMVCEFLTFDKR